MSEQEFKKTYNSFTKFVLWGTIVVIAILVILAAVSDNVANELYEEALKLLTPCWFFAIQVSEIVFPKSGGENWQFQCFIFCYMSAVKRIFAK